MLQQNHEIEKLCKLTNTFPYKLTPLPHAHTHTLCPLTHTHTLCPLTHTHTCRAVGSRGRGPQTSAPLAPTPTPLGDRPNAPEGARFGTYVCVCVRVHLCVHVRVCVCLHCTCAWWHELCTGTAACEVGVCEYAYFVRVRGGMNYAQGQLLVK